MAFTRMTMEQMAGRTPDVDWAKVEATTEEEIRQHMIEDGEDPDAELGPGRRVVPVGNVRRRLALSEEAFATLIGVELETLRAWEAQCVTPDRAVQTLIAILYREPDAALRALRPAPVPAQ